MYQYAEVIVPLPLGPAFTYAIPEAMRPLIAVGMRVVVPFGARKFHTGIVTALTMQKPDFDVKAIASLPDKAPVVRNWQLKMWSWMAEYYLCSQGEVLKAALPAGLRIESETQIEANPDFDAGQAAAVLTERELFAWQSLTKSGRVTLLALAKETGMTQNISDMANRLITKGAAIVSEKLVERFRAKKEYFVRAAFERGNEKALKDAFQSVSRAKKQETALMQLLHLSQFTKGGAELREVPRAELLDKAQVTSAVLSQLVDKGLAEVYWRETSRFSYDGCQTAELPTLSPAQSRALDDIHRQFLDKKITLLHGVTSSGKTEIYMHLIDYVLRQRMQVLYLVPEIALTTQLTRRLQHVFGSKVVIYHSRFSDNERVEVWRRLLRTGEPCVVIGARSSVFLPFEKLGLVIVDEEHESSYKQFDPAPRYNARDAATVLASLHGAKTLLGSATPTVEAYYKAVNGKYGLVTLTERYAGIELPQIQTVDLVDARKRMQLNGAFAQSTVKAVSDTVQAGKQAILFHNRRGYAPIARCRQCAYTPKCRDCDVSLTYHQRSNLLVCHYCGATYPLPDTCPVCDSPQVDVLGFGTERVEDDIQQIFAKARILRMDLDTTRNKNDYANIIDAFSQHKADILVGTQMVTKGLDFADVQTVVVVNADNLIHYPDFRAGERAFNMLEQVAGRAGRKGAQGTVLVQTREPAHPIIEFAKTHDYKGYYAHELSERQAYNYPPFTRIVYVYVKHADPRVVDDIAQRYAAQLRSLLGDRVFGPEEPAISRIQKLYIRKIMLKIEPQASMQRVKETLRRVYVDLHHQSQMKGMVVYYDVDPY